MIVRVDRRNGNVPNATELTAVVEMFVLQTEKVPHEPTEYFQRSQNRRHQITGNDFVLRQCVRYAPHEPEEQVLDDGKIVEELREDRGYYNDRTSRRNTANILQELSKRFPLGGTYFPRHSYRISPNPF